MLMKYKSFGATLDVIDTKDALQIKIAYLNSLSYKMKLSSDYSSPYKALSSYLAKNKNVILGGEIPFPSCFTPRPKINDLLKVNQNNYTLFLEKNKCKLYADKVKNYVVNFVFPNHPFMIGVDHSLTGGVISALSQKYQKENITFLIIDAHFDALPPRVRTGEVFSSELPDNIYHAGNFIDTLIKEGRILPENLVIIGVSDYPDKNMKNNDFVKYYLSYEKKGVKFVRKKEVGENKLDKILKDIKTKYLYVSLDVDVSAHQDVYAARFLDKIGITEDDLYKVAKKIKYFTQRKNIELIGLDIMEINVHFLDLKLKDGTRDRTLSICKNYLRHLLY